MVFIVDQGSKSERRLRLSDFVRGAARSLTSAVPDVSGYGSAHPARLSQQQRDEHARAALALAPGFIRIGNDNARPFAQSVDEFNSLRLRGEI